MRAFVAKRQAISRLLPPVVADGLRGLRSNRLEKRATELWRESTLVPWTPEYSVVRERFLRTAAQDAQVLALFEAGIQLPVGYGVGLDERCVEYLWFLGRNRRDGGLLLDAGSTLNYDWLLSSLVVRRKTIHILTLAPEGVAFWEQGISYLYGDLRDLPQRDNLYDEVVCLSTLEHVGLDNSPGTGRQEDKEEDPTSALTALREMRRVLKPGGSLYLSVPFGKAETFKTFRQLDLSQVEELVHTFEPQDASITYFSYGESGWKMADAQHCGAALFSRSALPVFEDGARPSMTEPDRAAAARAVACLELRKPE